MVSNVTRFTRNALVASALVIGGLPALALAQGTATPSSVTAPAASQLVSQAGTVPAVTNAAAAQVKPDDAKKAADLKAIPAKPVAKVEGKAAIAQPAIAKTGETVKDVKTTPVKAPEAKAIDSKATVTKTPATKTLEGNTSAVTVPATPKL